MKKLLFIVFVCILAFAVFSCSQQSGNGTPAIPADASSQAQNINLPLLSGYPQDILPLYHPDKLLSSGFSYREHDYYAVGKEVYLITYESTAAQQDLYKYYSGLLTQNDATPAPSASDADAGDSDASDSVSGKIGSSGVEIDLLDNSDNTTTVYLTLGLPQEKYIGSNPYFAGYPSGLVDQYGVQSKQEDTYQEQYYGSKSIHYITVYTTALTQQQFLDYYKKYASKQDFKQALSDNGASLAWQDQGFSCEVRFAGGKSGYITIDIFKQG